MLVPSPPKWNRESGRLSAPPLFSMPNIRRSQSLAELAAPFLRIVFNPQKVKKTVTCMPIAAAPVAMIKAAIARSRSPLKRTIVTFSGFDSCSWASVADGSICVICMGASIRLRGANCRYFQGVLTIASVSFSCQGNELDRTRKAGYSPARMHLDRKLDTPAA